MRALKQFVRLLSPVVSNVTTQAHEGIETINDEEERGQQGVTTQAHEGIETMIAAGICTQA